MQLKEFSLNSPRIESGTVLKALETAIPTEAIEQAIAPCVLWIDEGRPQQVTLGDLMQCCENIVRDQS
ncbi:hypothetical protein [Nostoc sp.]|uniref:hypothetical protein n=1 Tax=Nostoc sp. TaxID=1180 RepID=UPI002FF52AE9